MLDRSNGYEAIAAEFVSSRSSTIGVTRVREWAKALPVGAAVVDLGCGPGVPITEVLAAEGLTAYGVDAAPSFVQAFRRSLPGTPIACEAVQDSKFFDRTFDAVLAWGLMFLLSPEDQRRLDPEGCRHTGAGRQTTVHISSEIGFGNDVMTGLESRSLGAEEYRRLSANPAKIRDAGQDQRCLSDAFLIETSPVDSSRHLPGCTETLSERSER